MRVIFQEDVKGVAKRGDVKEVKDGYARNYLIPKGYAVQATPGRERQLNDQRQRQALREQREREEMTELADTLANQVIVVKAKVGDSDRLFGTVTNGDIAEALRNLGHAVDRKKISVEPIKHLGQYEATLHLFRGVSTRIMVKVEAEN